MFWERNLREKLQASIRYINSVVIRIRTRTILRTIIFILRTRTRTILRTIIIITIIIMITIMIMTIL